jgi:hypothetical protein
MRRGISNVAKMNHLEFVFRGIGRSETGNEDERILKAHKTQLEHETRQLEVLCTAYVAARDNSEASLLLAEIQAIRSKYA